MSALHPGTDSKVRSSSAVNSTLNSAAFVPQGRLIFPALLLSSMVSKPLKALTFAEDVMAFN